MNANVWYTRPGVVLSAVLALVVLTALFVRTPVTGREGDPRLISTSTDPLGAALLHDLSRRLGYRTERAAIRTTWAPGAIVTELDPAIELTPTTVHELLQHVRSGGALLASLGRNTQSLADSLHIAIDRDAGTIETRVGTVRPCARSARFTRTGLWFGPPILLPLRMQGAPRAHRTFIFVRSDSPATSANQPRPVMIGLPLGNGRVVIASDPDVFRNDALRDCAYGLDVAAVAALEYLDEGRADRRTIVFDDYHQRRVAVTGITGVVQQYLVTAPSGRLLLQICVAGLILLLASAPRLLPPRATNVTPRRSPLEHVDALARAYATVGATRTGVLRLVHGLERRVGHSARVGAALDDDAFLARVADSSPTLTDEVTLIRHALAHTVSPQQFTDVAKAIARIEHTLTHS